MAKQKFVCLSDTHGLLPNTPPADFLLIAGDITPVRDHSIVFQQQWFANNFIPWLIEQPSKYLVFIGGNHDFFLPEKEDYKWTEALCHPMKTRPIYYLQDRSITLDGIKIWGSPWQKRFFDWNFNLDEPELAEKYAKIPDDVDVIISHGPAYGYGDLVPPRKFDEEKWPQGEHVGSPSLLKRIDEIKPKLVVVGHIHSGYSTIYRRCGSYGNYVDTAMVNASYVNEQYKYNGKPIQVVEI